MTQPGYEIGRGPDGLTARERAVLGGVAEGLDMVQIGHRLGVSKQRVKQIMSALEKKSRLIRSGDTWTILVKKGA